MRLDYYPLGWPLGPGHQRVKPIRIDFDLRLYRFLCFSLLTTKFVSLWEEESKQAVSVLIIIIKNENTLQL